MTGNVPNVRRKFSLKDILEKMILLLQPKALEKKLNITLHLDEKIPTYLIGDPIRIQRIFLELISNALNFTDKGQIDIRLEMPKKEKSDLVLKATVQDTGIGIPADKVDEIFLRFNRLTPSYEGIYKGNGLGLTTVKQFIDDIKAEIYCQSKVGEGTIFTCLFPLQEALLDSTEDVWQADEIPCKPDSKEYLKTESKDPNDSDKIKILVVEDQKLAAVVAQTIIKGLNCSVDVIDTGLKAIKYIDEANYDLIFMDIGLPDLNGFEVTKQIRAKEWKRDRHVPIVALTAHIDTENKQKCIECGMDAVLPKPLRRNTAEDVINAFIPARQIASPSEEVKTKDLPTTEDELFQISRIPSFYIC
jgi:CheY-like chemotaxis protein/two-component sensor histidine kinase